MKRIIISYADGRYSWAHKWHHCADNEHCCAYANWLTYTVFRVIRWLDRYNQQTLMHMENAWYKLYRGDL